jgi:transposase
MNHVLHIAAVVQLRHATEGSAYYDCKVAAHKTPMEALRALKRRLSDVVYRQLVADATPPRGDWGRGGSGRALRDISSAADLPPHIGTSGQPLPGPAHPTLPPSPPRPNPLPVPAAATPRRRAGAVKVQRPTGRTT